MTQAAKPYKRKLRNYLINKEFQLRYTLISVVIAAILCGGLGALIVWQMRDSTEKARVQRVSATEFVKRQREDATGYMVKMRVGHTRYVKMLMKEATAQLDVQLLDKDEEIRAMAKVKKEYLEELDRKEAKRLKDEDEKFASMRKKADGDLVEKQKKQDKETLEQRKSQEMILLISIVSFGLIFLVIIFLFNIVVTHKTAGPLFKMGRYIDEVRDNKFSEVWSLRKGDQLMEFYERFRGMHCALKDRQAEDIEVLEAILKECESKGISGDAVTRLRERLDSKKQSFTPAT